ncbi:MAG: hypothetical protein OXE94_12005 [Aestuariivita sp.]|nr:hypothetical protein [Aestuariivita sp.]
MKPIIAVQRVRLPSGKGIACQPEARVAWQAVTRVVDCRSCDGTEHGQQDRRFDFLGFTHLWGKS